MTVISLYGMFDEEGYVTAALHRVLSDLTPLLHKEKNKRLFVIAGGYNLSKQCVFVFRRSEKDFDVISHLLKADRKP